MWGVRDFNGMLHGRKSLAMMCVEGAAAAKDAPDQDEGGAGQDEEMMESVDAGADMAGHNLAFKVESPLT